MSQTSRSRVDEHAFELLGEGGRNYLRGGSGNAPGKVSIGTGHRTIGHTAGVQFEREEFLRFSLWLDEDTEGTPLELLGKYVRPIGDDGCPRYVRAVEQTRSEFRLTDLQTQLSVTKMGLGQLAVTARWLGSGNARTTVLDADQSAVFGRWVRRALVEWL